MIIFRDAPVYQPIIDIGR